jgi:CoA-transferase family III
VLGCPALEWAASGGMALTGHASGLPVLSPAPAFALLSLVLDSLCEVTSSVGTGVRANPSEVLTGRAGLAGFTRRGRVSAGGSSRLLRAASGWCAVTLSRADDVTAVPAVLGMLGLAVPGVANAEGAWAALAAAAVRQPGQALADAAQLLGVPAAVLPFGVPPAGMVAVPPDTAWPPWQVSQIATPLHGARLAGALVVDLSSMWAGPLSARLLGLAGARVVKVESPNRPDGARVGNAGFFDWLHAEHESVAIDFRTRSGRAALAALLAAADVVIEASRPRALASLGLAPEQIPHRDGQVWLSITGYGRGEPALVAFGDDAAVAGGLVGWTDGEPVFCADAIADPLAGVCGALAVARSLAGGGGHLIDLSMRAVAAAFAAPSRDPDCPGPHAVTGTAADAVVTCHAVGLRQPVLPPRRLIPTGRAAELGTDTATVLGALPAF